MRRSKGSISKVANGKWLVRISVGIGRDGRQVRKSKTVRGSKRKAEEVLALMLATAGCGDAPDIVLGDYIRLRYAPWMDSRVDSGKPDQIRRLTRMTQKSLERAILDDGISSIRMHDLQRRMPEVDEWISSSTDALALARRRTITSIINRAVGDGYSIHARPSRVEYSPKEKPTIRLEDVDAYLEAVRGTRIEAVVTLMIACGLRVSEAVGLDWEDIEWVDGDGYSGIFTITRSRKVVGKIVYDDAPKTKSSHRTVAIPSKFGGRLKELRGAGCIANSADGKPMSREALHREWERSISELPYVPLKNLRHSFGTIMVREMGANISDVAQVMGHSSIATTEKYYLQADFAPIARTASMWGCDA